MGDNGLCSRRYLLSTSPYQRLIDIPVNYVKETGDEVPKQRNAVEGCIEIHWLLLTREQRTRWQKMVTVKDNCGSEGAIIMTK